MTLQQPDFVLYSYQDDNFQYYKYFKETPVSEKYLLTIVRHLNVEGFVITSFWVEKIKNGGKEVVYGEENLPEL